MYLNDDIYYAIISHIMLKINLRHRLKYIIKAVGVFVIYISELKRASHFKGYKSGMQKWKSINGKFPVMKIWEKQQWTVTLSVCVAVFTVTLSVCAAVFTVTLSVCVAVFTVPFRGRVSCHKKKK